MILREFIVLSFAFLSPFSKHETSAVWFFHHVLKFVDVFSFKLQGIPLNVTAYTGSYAVYAGKGRGKNFGNRSTINII